MEWGLDGYKGKDGPQYVLKTSHSISEIATLDVTNYGFGLQNQMFDIHSHPGPDGTPGASGDYGTFVSGDMSRIGARYQKAENMGVPLPPHYVYHKESRVLYNYTPWESSIFIKKVQNNQALRYLFPR